MKTYKLIERFILLFIAFGLCLEIISATIPNLNFQIDANGNVKYVGQENAIGETLGFLSSSNPTEVSTSVYTNAGIPIPIENKDGQQVFKTSLTSSEAASLKQKIIQKLNLEYKQFAEHLDNIKQYVQRNFKQGEIEIKDGTTLIKANGETVAEIPIDFKVEKSDKELRVVGSSFVSSKSDKNNQLKIRGYNIETKLKAEILFSEENNIKTIKLNGIGNIEAEGRLLNGVKDAVVKIGEKGIEYADFLSAEGGNYILDYNKNNFLFSIKKNGRVTFDPKKGEISTNGAEKILYKGQLIETSGKVVFKINDNGEPISAVIEKGSFKNTFGEKFSSKNSLLNVFFDGKEHPETKGDYVSMGKNNILMKGKVIAEQLGSNFQYSGAGDDSLTDFNRDKSFFDVKKGDSEFGNYRYTVKVENGEAKVRFRDDKLEGKDFGFSHLNSKGESVEGYFDRENGKYVISYKENGENKVLSIPLSSINGEFKDTNLLYSRDKITKSIETELKDIEQKLSKASDKQEIENLQLQKIEKSSQLAVLKGEGVEASISELYQYMMTDLSKEGLLKANEIMGDLISDRGKPRDVGRLFSINNQEMISSIGMIPIYSDQKLDFEVDKNGNVRAYIFDGKRVEFNGDNTEIISGLALGNKEAIKYLLENGATLDNLQTSRYAGSLTSQGYSTYSPEYQSALKDAEKAREYYGYVKEKAILSGDNELVGNVELKIAGTYLLNKDTQKAIESFESIASGDYSNDIKSSAKLLAAGTSFNQDPVLNLEFVQSSISEALKLNPNNIEARAFNLEFEKFRLERFYKIAYGETTLTNQEINNMLGDGYGIVRDAKDVLSIIFQPATNAYVSKSKIDEILEKQQQNYDLSTSLQEASSEMIKLNGAGIDTNTYSQSSYSEKFAAVYRINNFEETLSLTELNNYMKRAGVDSSDPSTFDSGFKKLTDMIRDEKGYAAAALFEQNLLGTLNKVAVIENFIANKESYLNTGRIGTEIRYSNSEYYLLSAGDTLLNPLTYLGVSAAVKSGALSQFSFNVGKEALMDVTTAAAAEAYPPLGLALGAGRLLKGFSGGSGTGLSAEIREIDGAQGKYLFLSISSDQVDNYARSLEREFGSIEIDKVKGLLKLEDGSIIKYGEKFPSGASFRSLDELVEAGSENVGNTQRRISLEAEYAKAVDVYGTDGLASEVYIYNWGRLSEKLVKGESYAGMIERMRIDSENIPASMTSEIKSEFDSTIGKIKDGMTMEEAYDLTKQFSTSMNDKLPYIGYKNIGTAREENPKFGVLLNNYLKIFEGNEPPPRLSELAKSGYIDCTGQALLIQDTLGGRKSGWTLYHSLYKGYTDPHTFLAKDVVIGGQKSVVIIDPTEYIGYRSSLSTSFPPGISGYNNLPPFIYSADDFYRKGFKIAQ